MKNIQALFSYIYWHRVGDTGWVSLTHLFQAKLCRCSCRVALNYSAHRYRLCWQSVLSGLTNFLLDRGLTCGLHQGQRWHAPYQKAGHMTETSKVTQINPYKKGAVHARQHPRWPYLPQIVSSGSTIDDLSEMPACVVLKDHYDFAGR